jgi:regulator of replication initiation timing
MPTLSQAQIREIEIEMADLVEEINALRKENQALLAQLQRLMATPSE